jgi:hypothetical protein
MPMLAYSVMRPSVRVQIARPLAKSLRDLSGTASLTIYRNVSERPVKRTVRRDRVRCQHRGGMSR